MSLFKRVENDISSLFLSLFDKKVLVNLKKIEQQGCLDFYFFVSHSISSLVKKSVDEIIVVLLSKSNSAYFNFKDEGLGLLRILFKDEQVNFFLSEALLGNFLIDTPLKDQKVLIDFFGPNISKPPHMEHLRNTVIGETLRRVLRLAQCDVHSDMHYGDSSFQLSKVIFAAEQRGCDIYAITPDTILDFYLAGDAAFKAAQENAEKIWEIAYCIQEDNSSYGDWISFIISNVLKSFIFFQKKVGAHFDYVNGESTYKNILAVFLSNPENESNISVKSGRTSLRKTRLLLKNEYDCYVYESIDFAALLKRTLIDHFDKIIYVITKRQSKHWETVFKSAHLFSPNTQFVHLAHGLIFQSEKVPYPTDVSAHCTPCFFLEKMEKFFIENKCEQEDITISHKIGVYQTVCTTYKFYDHLFDPIEDYIVNGEVLFLGNTSPLKIIDFLHAAAYGDTLKISNKFDEGWKILILEFSYALEATCTNVTLKPLAFYIQNLFSLYQNVGLPENTDLQSLVRTIAMNCYNLIKGEN